MATQENVPFIDDQNIGTVKSGTPPIICCTYCYSKKEVRTSIAVWVMDLDPFSDVRGALVPKVVWNSSLSKLVNRIQR